MDCFQLIYCYSKLWSGAYHRFKDSQESTDFFLVPIDHQNSHFKLVTSN